MERVRVDAVLTGARRVRGLAVTGRVVSAVVVVVLAVVAVVKGAGVAKAVAATVMRVRWVRASASSPS
ncbi:hypothetical protein OV208_09045 [Corallococcus sp. bb12-1]|uniref:hypothetical protein n=1 Tax=Corallococcus sp. bb12-1 TaxID=2996784 RepID=UPI00226EDA42|nr:hypothetical protein [Corallococcus sp. bb12-1]MCY1041458.1 hypothetical protein [Corallococcus sp. bb12-1]